MNTSVFEANKPNVFGSISSFDAGLQAKGISRNQVSVSETNTGKFVLTAGGQMFATIHKDLKKSDLAQTKQSVVAAILSTEGCVFGLPAEATDDMGNNNYPCLMISKSTWKSETLGL